MAATSTQSTNANRPDRSEIVRGTAVPVLVGLLIGAIFAAVFLAAFHDPKPHDLPVAVVAPPPVVAAVEAQSAANGNAFDVRPYDSVEVARDAVSTHEVFGAFVAGTPTAELIVAGANGPPVTEVLTRAFGAAAGAAGATLTVTDVAPLAAGDSRGLSVFYAAFGVVLAGFLFGLTSMQAGPRLPAAWRAVSAVAFAVLVSIVVAWLVGPVFDALPASFLLTCTLVGLLALAVGISTAALLKLFGPVGIFVAAVVLLVFGNATSTGILPAQFLPGWLEPLAGILPVGVTVRALRGAAYFDNHGVAAGIAVLEAWIFGAVIVYGIASIVQSRRRGA
ncbi:ABC transporter permease [Prescottella agglutinans]|uniref:ABC transporter permease n=1 Tax=Prescottella agglutinans TaxID=1644129 RepID=A0A438BBZ8_9NOCA|nr:ABC transporter permease [Prescottella agglutinans]RVW08553.1 ABC transporter permease [Prescottella agglutinans]